jgi:hypothetical protein
MIAEDAITSKSICKIQNGAGILVFHTFRVCYNLTVPIDEIARSLVEQIAEKYAADYPDLPLRRVSRLDGRTFSPGHPLAF